MRVVGSETEWDVGSKVVDPGRGRLSPDLEVPRTCRSRRRIGLPTRTGRAGRSEDRYQVRRLSHDQDGTVPRWA